MWGGMTEEKMHFSSKWKGFCAVLFYFTASPSSQLTENQSSVPNTASLCALCNIWKLLAPVDNKGTSWLVKVCSRCPRNSAPEVPWTNQETLKQRCRTTLGRTTFLSEELFLASGVSISFPWAECLIDCIFWVCYWVFSLLTQLTGTGNPASSCRCFW